MRELSTALKTLSPALVMLKAPLVVRGQPKKGALVACIRRLLGILCAIFRSQIP